VNILTDKIYIKVISLINKQFNGCTLIHAFIIINFTL